MMTKSIKVTISIGYTEDENNFRCVTYIKNYVTNLLKKAKRIDLENVKIGKYFRIVANVKIDGISLGEILLKNGYAYKYYGKTKKKIDWCKKQQRDCIY